MLRVLRPPRINLSSSTTTSPLWALQHVRLLATEAPLPSPTAGRLAPLPPLKKKEVPEGPLRPHHNVEVNPSHGLWAFFRKKLDQEGVVSYETLEPKGDDWSGRSWTAAELRRKSFKDLHVLWYVVLRERNLLATQSHELGRVGAIMSTTAIQQHTLRCRKTMARIKYVINERRLAYESAVNILVKERESEVAARRKMRKETRKAKVGEEEKQLEAARRPRTEQEAAADTAVAGVFDTVPDSVSNTWGSSKPKVKPDEDQYVI